MKRIFNIIAIALACAFVISQTACTDDPLPAGDITASPDSLIFPAEGSTQDIDITSESYWSYKVSEPWIIITRSDNTLSVTVGKTKEAREGTITVSNNDGKTKEIIVDQEAPLSDITASIGTLTFPAWGGTQSVDITSDADWDFTVSDTWIEVVKSDGTLSVMVNDTGEVREGSITVTNTDGNSADIAVVQDAPIVITADDLVGTWDGYFVYYNILNGSSMEISHVVTITKIDDTHVLADNAFALDQLSRTINLTWNRMVIAVNSDGTITTEPTALPNFTTDPTVTASYMGGLVSGTPRDDWNKGLENITVRDGVIDFSEVGYPDYLMGTGTVNGAFWPLGEINGGAGGYNHFNMAFCGNKWTKRRSITVNPNILKFSDEGGTKTVTVTSDSDWTIVASEPWFTADKSGNTISITVGASATARNGKITVSNSTDKADLVIDQNPTNGSGINDLVGTYSVASTYHRSGNYYNADHTAVITKVDASTVKIKYFLGIDKILDNGTVDNLDEVTATYDDGLLTLQHRAPVSLNTAGYAANYIVPARMTNYCSNANLYLPVYTVEGSGNNIRIDFSDPEGYDLFGRGRASCIVLAENASGGCEGALCTFIGTVFTKISNSTADPARKIKKSGNKDLNNPFTAKM